MNHYLRTLLLLTALLYGSNLHAQKKNNFEWLAGTWKIATPNGSIVEQWKSINDSTLSGKSYFVKSTGDTIPQEIIELRLRKGQWAYVPTVNGQNNNQPTTFQVIFIGKEEFISSNPAHDFPQRIAYRRIKDQLFATIEGIRKGKYAKQNFDFKIE
ncbi:MAG: hypothetical protein HYZ44_10810 [Bacteroidetes bacterium]|nr:hypothetical protein [Bacteroidota bacterium]